jgi:hypothetical protein
MQRHGVGFGAASLDDTTKAVAVLSDAIFYIDKHHDQLRSYTSEGKRFPMILYKLGFAYLNEEPTNPCWSGMPAEKVKQYKVEDLGVDATDQRVRVRRIPYTNYAGQNRKAPKITQADIHKVEEVSSKLRVTAVSPDKLANDLKLHLLHLPGLHSLTAGSNPDQPNSSALRFCAGGLKSGWSGSSESSGSVTRTCPRTRRPLPRWPTSAPPC